MLEDKSKIIKIEIEDQLKKAYMEYSMSVIVSRALPDVRDGLKPSQRRILYAMKELNLNPGGGYRKCAKIAGDTSGNYHPHGEQVIYPTLVRLAQSWNMRYPLINGQGNFGSIDGDPPAAMRYTEAKLQKASVDLMEDLAKDTVDFRSNYDETRKEPVIFPSKFPNLLVNGTSGIAVGMATSIPPHNIGEVCSAIIAYVNNPEMAELDFLDHIKGPDFPTGGFILGKSEIRKYFETGKAKIRVRGRTHIESVSNVSEQIVITQIPYQLNKTLLIERIVALVKEKRIEGISDIRDESDRKGMRLVIKVKKNEDPNVVLNQLYKFSQMEQTFSVINLALVNGEPKVLSVKEMIKQFVNFRHKVIIRRTQFELKNAQEKLHILEGYKIALDNLDEVLEIIKNSKNGPEASIALQSRFSLSEAQTKAILDMRLQRLTGLEREKIEEEYLKTQQLVEELSEILAKKELQMQILIEEVNYIKEKYEDPRKTEILESEGGDINLEDLISDDEMVITISQEGYIKKIPLETYKTQNRGGKGVSGVDLKSKDFVKSIFVASNLTYILFFSNLGKCYWLKVYSLPELSRQAKGKPIINLLPLAENEKILAYETTKDFPQDKYIIMATKKGLVKKSKLADFSKPRANGIIAVKLNENDELISAKISSGEDNILLATKNGYVNRFKEEEVRIVGRNSIGVRGIKLRENDDVIAMIIFKEENSTLLAITKKGYGKRTGIENYSITRRGSKGVTGIKTDAKNGQLVQMMEVSDDEEIMIVTKEGIIIRQEVKSISIIGRVTKGVKLINLSAKDEVYDITKIAKEDDAVKESQQLDLFNEIKE